MNVVLGITGGIAAYKGAEIISRLKKKGIDVKVIMTENAKQFISPLTLQTLSGYPVYYDTFKHATENYEIDHISLAKWADIMLIAPATANIISKVCHGIADDLLSTTIMATRGQVVFAPAMNTNMYKNPILQDNIEALKKRGYMFIPPAKGLLACGDVGEGRLAEVDDIVAEVVGLLRQRDDLKGTKVLVTAGPTREYIDPVRFISNPSSGRMGYAIADACRKRGAEVHLITGPTNIKTPVGVHVYRVETAYEMYDAVMSLFGQCQIVFKTAAVGDYRPDMVSSQKIKKDADDLVIRFVKNPDILKELGRRKKNQILVGFAAETENIEVYANKKLKEKNLDFIFVNDVSKTGAGFAGDTNGGILLCADGDRLEMSITKKEIIAQRILDVIIDRKLDK